MNPLKQQANDFHDCCYALLVELRKSTISGKDRDRLDYFRQIVVAFDPQLNDIVEFVMDISFLLLDTSVCSKFSPSLVRHVFEKAIEILSEVLFPLTCSLLHQPTINKER